MKKLTASDGQEYDEFGRGVSISGNLAIVGASGEDAQGSNAGAAYIYRTTDDGASWSEVKKLTASDGQPGVEFGRGVSISGNLAIVRASGKDAQGSDAGMAYIYRTTDDGASWSEVKKLTASDGQLGDKFGVSVSISGNLAIVGASGEDAQGDFAGAAYIYIDPLPPPSPPPLPTEAAPGVDFDPPRGGGLPLCKCDAYHNKAFQLMSRMCQKEWMGQNICYPTTRVKIENNDWSQGTFLNGRLFDNRCDKYMTMCSPWSPPVRPTEYQ